MSLQNFYIAFVGVFVEVDVLDAHFLCQSW